MPHIRPQISVCIPVFNYRVSSLMAALAQMVKELPQNSVELLFWDDGSTREFVKSENRQKAKELPTAHYYENVCNIGRSRIRNRMGKKAGGAFLLFLDCDVMPASESFLKQYLACCTSGEVACGGVLNPPGGPDTGKALRYKYGRYREARSPHERKKHPWRSFSTANFLVERSFFLQHPFDETLTRYGHEDTLWGYRLKQNKVPVKHIYNPVEHHGMETDAVFLEKTRLSVQNLVQVWQSLDEDKPFLDEVNLLSAGIRLKKMKLSHTVHRVLRSMMPRIEKNLKSPKPSLLLFDLYKLFYLLEGLQSGER